MDADICHQEQMDADMEPEEANDEILPRRCCLSRMMLLPRLASQETTKDREPDGATSSSPCIICVGNPGAGKSTLLNSLLGEVVFRAGFSLGQGLTQHLQKEEHGGIVYIDTPGLADSGQRKRAAEEVTRAFRTHTSFKLVFVITLEACHIRPQDKATMELVLDAIQGACCSSTPEYCVVVNKVLPGLEIASSRIHEQLNFRAKGIAAKEPFILQYVPDCEDQSDTLLKVPPGFWTLLEELPAIQLNCSLVSNIQWDKFAAAMTRIKREIQDIEKQSRELRDKLKEQSVQAEHDYPDRDRIESFIEIDSPSSWQSAVQEAFNTKRWQEHYIIKATSANGVPLMLSWLDGVPELTFDGKLDFPLTFKIEGFELHHSHDWQASMLTELNAFGLLPRDAVSVKDSHDQEQHLTWLDTEPQLGDALPPSSFPLMFTFEAPTIAAIKTEKMKELAQRGFQLGTLLDLYAKLGTADVMEHFDPEKSTTSDVVRAAIIPATADRMCSYAELQNGQSLDKSTSRHWRSWLCGLLASVNLPACRKRGISDHQDYLPALPSSSVKMVSHNWDNLFSNFVAAIIADAMDLPAYKWILTRLRPDELPNLRSDLQRDGLLNLVYWACPLSVNQHHSMCKFVRSDFKDKVTGEQYVACACSATHFCNADPRCEMDKFDDMMVHMLTHAKESRHVIAIDRKCEIFSRAWVIAELVVAKGYCNGLQQCYRAFDNDSLQRFRTRLEGQQIDIRRCKATNPKDIELILKKAEEAIKKHQCSSTCDYDQFNAELSKDMFKSIDNVHEEITKMESDRVHVVCIGNRGVGTKTILRSMMGEVCEPVAGQPLEYHYRNTAFVASSGLADDDMRQQAAMEITKALRKGGSYKIFFVVTLEAGRVRPDDKEMIRRVLEAVPQTASLHRHCAVIINKATQFTAEHLKASKLKVISRELFPSGDCTEYIRIVKRQSSSASGCLELPYGLVQDAPLLRIQGNRVQNVNGLTAEQEADEYRQILRDRELECRLLAMMIRDVVQEQDTMENKKDHDDTLEKIRDGTMTLRATLRFLRDELFHNRTDTLEHTLLSPETMNAVRTTCKILAPFFNHYDVKDRKSVV